MICWPENCDICPFLKKSVVRSTRMCFPYIVPKQIVNCGLELFGGCIRMISWKIKWHAFTNWVIYLFMISSKIRMDVFGLQRLDRGWFVIIQKPKNGHPMFIMRKMIIVFPPTKCWVHIFRLRAKCGLLLKEEVYAVTIVRKITSSVLMKETDYPTVSLIRLLRILRLISGLARTMVW